MKLTSIQRHFVEKLMPGIIKNCRSFAKRKGMDPEMIEEVIAEALAHSWEGYYKSKKGSTLSAGNIWFITRCRIKSGRAFAGRSRPRDLLSRLVQLGQGITVKSLSDPSDEACLALEGLVDDRSDPARTVPFKLDLDTFTKSLPKLQKKLLPLILKAHKGTKSAAALRVSYSTFRSALLKLRSNAKAFYLDK